MFSQLGHVDQVRLVGLVNLGQLGQVSYVRLGYLGWSSECPRQISASQHVQKCLIGQVSQASQVSQVSQVSQDSQVRLVRLGQVSQVGLVSVLALEQHTYQILASYRAQNPLKRKVRFKFPPPEPHELLLPPSKALVVEETAELSTDETYEVTSLESLK